MRSPVSAVPVALLVLAAIAAIPAAAGAQLLEDRVVGEQRFCLYVGSEQRANGETVPRNLVVPAGQPCPDIAPYRDPNQHVPGNAALLRDRVENGRRVCVYGQGGVEYLGSVPLSRYCAATPDLLRRGADGPDPAAPFAH